MIKIFSSSVDLDESDKATVPGIKQQFFPHRKKEKKHNMAVGAGTGFNGGHSGRLPVPRGQGG